MLVSIFFLKVYGKLLKTDKRVALIFYQGSTDATLSKGTAVLCPKSDRFLNHLSKLTGAICVISDEPKDDIPIKFFTPSQAIQDLMQWLRDI
ncbi:hypothetical protein SD80_017780 [Scytonema tolypothrichoides VB-61278]|nr:hypothetical protein SD80_017780 [Scytonema tolypothrichoides VB-61278]